MFARFHNFVEMFPYILILSGIKMKGNFMEEMAIFTEEIVNGKHHFLCIEAFYPIETNSRDAHEVALGRPCNKKL